MAERKTENKTLYIGQRITAVTSNAGRSISICNSGRFAKDVYFALQMPTNILSLLVAFR